MLPQATVRNRIIYEWLSIIAYEYPRALTPETANTLALLQSARNRTDVAALLSIRPSVLSYWLYIAPPSTRYRSHSIPKKTGGLREIMEPQGKLKLAQSKLAEILSPIYEEAEQQRLLRARNRGEPSPCVLSHGFKHNYDIRTNAAAHRGKRFVLNVDIKDFFSSISFGRVRGFFINDKTFGLRPEVATVLAQIACFKNKLPQGSPCSPVISNLVAHILDLKLNKLALEGNCSYTRYVDDLTFSTNETSFPTGIGRLVAGTTDRWVAGNELMRQVHRGGFRLNHDKTRMQRPHSRQDTTGLTVNSKVNVSAKYYKAVRAMCDHLFKHGYSYEYRRERFTRNISEIDSTDRCIKSKKYDRVRDGYNFISDDELQGKIDFIYFVRANRRKSDLDKLPKIDRPKAYMERENAFRDSQSALTSLYKHFLNYRSFHGLDAPVIVGEGITDALYIRAAIRTLGASFPHLFEKKGDEEKVLVNFFKHSDKRKFYQIGEGATGLKKFVEDFPSITQSFQQRVHHPVIVIVDNDKAGRDVLKACAKHGHKGLNELTPWCHVVKNLYIMPIPPNLDASGTAIDTAIEDLFDKSVFEPIDGKTFTKINDYDRSKHYGKSEFVQQIVRPKRASINWDNFTTLLARIEEIVVDYSAKIKT